MLDINIMRGAHFRPCSPAQKAPAQIELDENNEPVEKDYMRKVQAHPDIEVRPASDILVGLSQSTSPWPWVLCSATRGYSRSQKGIVATFCLATTGWICLRPSHGPHGTSARAVPIATLVALLANDVKTRAGMVS